MVRGVNINGWPEFVRSFYLANAAAFKPEELSIETLYRFAAKQGNYKFITEAEKVYSISIQDQYEARMSLIAILPHPIAMDMLLICPRGFTPAMHSGLASKFESELGNRSAPQQHSSLLPPKRIIKS